jgi:hypothetical protein
MLLPQAGHALLPKALRVFGCEEEIFGIRRRGTQLLNKIFPRSARSTDLRSIHLTPNPGLKIQQGTNKKCRESIY